MVNTLAARIVLTLVVMAALCSPVLSQDGQGGSTHPVQKKEKPGLLEFALHGINSSDTNYGQCLDDYRKLALDQTISRGYFWSNLLALGVSLFLLVVVAHQQKVQKRRALIAAEALTEYHNALARAETQIADATRKNHAFMELLAVMSGAEQAGPKEEYRVQPGRTKAKQDPANGQNSPAPKNGQAASNAAASNRLPAPKPTLKVADMESKEGPEASAVPSAARSSEVDLVTRINSLQQQLSTSQEREKQLRRQLNESELRLQKEQQKNRGLKTE